MKVVVLASKYDEKLGLLHCLDCLVLLKDVINKFFEITPGLQPVLHKAAILECSSLESRCHSQPSTVATEQ